MTASLGQLMSLLIHDLSEGFPNQLIVIIKQSKFYLINIM